MRWGQGGLQGETSGGRALWARLGKEVIPRSGHGLATCHSPPSRVWVLHSLMRWSGAGSVRMLHETGAGAPLPGTEGGVGWEIRGPQGHLPRP